MTILKQDHNKMTNLVVMEVSKTITGTTDIEFSIIVNNTKLLILIEGLENRAVVNHIVNSNISKDVKELVEEIIVLNEYEIYNAS